MEARIEKQKDGAYHLINIFTNIHICKFTDITSAKKYAKARGHIITELI